jgi:signal transduction histidine kinase
MTMQLKDRAFIMVALAFIACLVVVSAEFNAHAFSEIIHNQSVAHAPIWLTCLFTVMLATLPFLWFSRLSPIKALLSICVYIAIVIALVFFLAYFLKLWVAPTGAIFAILITYPLWSCAKLNSAQVALDQALQNLQDELTRMGMEQEAEQSHHGEDVQRARIHKLALTAKHLRDMHKSRSDALVFISHDIRAPLGAAMLLLQKFEHNMYSERMLHLLERAHTLAEGFLQASRAEMSDVNKYHELDMVSLAQQVIDDHYEQLDTKKIRLETKFPADGVWIRGDFGLLFRAVSNVLLNAVNYSPEQSVIKIVIDTDEVMSRLRVIDEGPGIPEDKIQQLFKRFSRADGQHQAQNGSGLGLYFVGITIRKHRGTVSVENVQSPGAEFVISIPLERRKNNIPMPYDRRVKPELTFEDII